MANHLVSAIENKFPSILEAYARIEARNMGFTFEETKTGVQQVIDEMAKALTFSVGDIQKKQGTHNNAYSVFLATGWFGANFRNQLFSGEFDNGLNQRARTAKTVEDFSGILNYMIEVFSKVQSDDLPEGLAEKQFSEAKKFAGTWWKPRVEDFASSLKMDLRNIPKRGQAY